jgi:hypothetical protein
MKQTCRFDWVGPIAPNAVQQKDSLLNHLVGAAGKWQRNGDAERFGGLEI